MIRKCKLQNEVALKPKRIYSEAVTNINNNFKTNEGRVEVVMQRIPTIITSKVFLKRGQNIIRAHIHLEIISLMLVHI
jgi:hypothetical protein